MKIRIDIAEEQLTYPTEWGTSEGIDALEVEGDVLRVFGWYEGWPESFRVGVRLTEDQRTRLVAALQERSA